jgi:hypothetical protein
MAPPTNSESPKMRRKATEESGEQSSDGNAVRVTNALADVVGFTDSFGRTSCATNEQEHYRLRILA